jgi:N-acylglucosamine-6-phosphate 2-epimerase
MTETNKQILQKIHRGLIVSCQALSTEPLYSAYIMGRMAFAAKEGGACGIRANTVVDITEIRKTVDLPVIGIIKAVYDGSDVYITPTAKEVEELIPTGVEIIAIDATDRKRPDGKSLDEFFGEIRKKYPDQLFMADCSSFEDCAHAAKIGFDLVGTTLCSYTEKTKGTPIPSYELLDRITRELNVPVIAEGGVWERDQLSKVFEYPVHAAVVGTAITRPRDITRRFVEAITK